MAQSVRFYEDPAFLRPQTYLILAATGLYGLAAALPVAELSGPVAATELGQVTVLGFSYASDTARTLLPSLGNSPLDWVLKAVFAIFLGLSFYTLGQYNRRAQQLKLALGLFVLALLGQSLTLFQAHQVQQQAITTLKAINGGFTPWFVALSTPPLLLLLARRMIQKDIQKIKKMDRFW
jgi:hypothetical protein